MKLPIYDKTKSQVGDIDINSDLFVVEAINQRLIAQYIKWQLAKRRSGTHATRGVSEISGTTKKPFRQKGTGNARQGSLRSPQHRGGAVIFGPKPRSYEFKINKKEKKIALRHVIADKINHDKLLVVQGVNHEVKKSKDAVNVINNFTNTGKVLVIDSGDIKSDYRSFANVANVDVLHVDGLNALSLIKADLVIVSEQAMEKIGVRLS
jgi:large subunit ribosomal protein L4